MDYTSLEFLGDTITHNIKGATWFPFRSGNLKFNATSGAMLSSTTYRIHFSSIVAPYLEYLEEGTNPHDIPGAFGYPLPFGVGGRFDGKFHPGSKKHKGFIKDKAVISVVNYIATKYNGQIEVI